MPFRQIVVIDCGASCTALGIFSVVHGALRCEQLSLEPLAPPAEAGMEEWLANTSVTLRELGNKHRYRGPAVLVLPPPVILLKHVKVPRVEAAKRERLVRFEVEQSIPYPIAEVVWGAVVSGGHEANEDLLLAAVKREVVASVFRMARGAGFRVRAAVPSALALHAAEKLTRANADDHRLLLHVGTRSATLLQIDGARFAARSWGLGPAPSSDGEGLATRLVQETNRSLLHFQRQANLTQPSRIILSAASAGSSQLAALVSAKLNLPAQVLPMSGALELGPATAELAATLYSLPEIVGAAALQLLPGQPAMNLLPLALLRRAFLRQRLPGLITTALLAIALVIYLSIPPRPARIALRTNAVTSETIPVSRPVSAGDEREAADTAEDEGEPGPPEEKEAEPLRLRLAGYFGSADGYLLALVASGSPETLFVRVGEPIPELDLTLQDFEVEKVPIKHEGPGLVYDVAGLATLFDESTGAEVVLDTRPRFDSNDASPRAESISASRLRETANHGP